MEAKEGRRKRTEGEGGKEGRREGRSNKIKRKLDECFF